jgi:DNA-binding GntR family transcriptional regulator
MLMTLEGLEQAAPPRLARGAQSGDIARLVAEQIVSGQMEPGLRLDEHGLARSFGVSRTPVREALGQLCAMGLAERRPHRGVFVAALSVTRLQDMFETMAELEASASRLATLNMTPAERQQLETMHLDSAALVKAGAMEAYAAFNIEFHQALYAGSHNSFLLELVEATRNRLAPFRRAQFSVLGRLAHSYEEHDAVVRAILRGDSDAAARAIRAHVLTVSAASAEYVSTYGPGFGDSDMAEAK